MAMAAAACAEPGAAAAGTFGAYATVGLHPHVIAECGRIAPPNMLDARSGRMGDSPDARPRVPGVKRGPRGAIAASRNGTPYRILVVEDDPDLLAILRTAAELHGHEVVVATDGAQAIEALHTLQPDLVLLDLMLPVIDGYRVLSTIRSHSRIGTVPVVVVSARASEGERALGLQMGATDYVTKPYAVSDVMGRVQTLMDQQFLAAH